MTKTDIKEKAEEMLDKKIAEALAEKYLEIRKHEVAIKKIKKEIDEILSGEALPPDKLVKVESGQCYTNSYIGGKFISTNLR
jgi:hypothetical protein